ncbi:phosphatase PAP2 family protein [Streptantibioticus parmotrematis]|uniref:phosphatase PAP2 family protein n=1 Tax=Streptantibioticus parmotrematis TaxID=2873249 RepID=UPI0033C350C4
MLAPSVAADVVHSAPGVRDLAFDGATIDGGLLTTITGWAHSAPPWFDDLVKYWSAYGIVIFAVYLGIAWWSARQHTPLMMARVLVTPVTVVLVYVVNDLIKSVVQEVRPCRQLPHLYHLEACQAPTDWAFPSNHTVVAFSAATAFIIIDRRLGYVAVLTAIAMGASRMWVGAHYPHDVAAGVVVGVVLAIPLTLAGGRFGEAAVERARLGRLKPVLTGPQGRRRARVNA